MTSFNVTVDGLGAVRTYTDRTIQSRISSIIVLLQTFNGEFSGLMLIFSKLSNPGQYYFYPGFSPHLSTMRHKVDKNILS